MDLAVHAPVMMESSRLANQRLNAIAHATEEGIVLDLEPVTDGFDHVLEGALRSQSLVRTSVCKLQHVNHEPIKVQMQMVCDELRNTLEYDRVMMYQFHDVGQRRL